jgi:CRP-like cAMP-binding protein
MSRSRPTWSASLEGVVSILSATDAEAPGRARQVATVGNEGMVGLLAFMGATSTPVRAFAQVLGETLRMPADAFREAATQLGPFSRLHDASGGLHRVPPRPHPGAGPNGPRVRLMHLLPRHLRIVRPHARQAATSSSPL